MNNFSKQVYHLTFNFLNMFLAEIKSVIQSNFSSKMDAGQPSTVRNTLSRFSEQVSNFVFAIMDNGTVVGTGLIVSSSFLMTALQLFEENPTELTLDPREKCDKTRRTIRRHVPKGDVALAYVSNSTSLISFS